METTDRDRLRDWVRNWQVVGPELERMRREDIRRANTQDSIQVFDLAFKAALQNTPPRNSSGLVEFQRLLRKLTGRRSISSLRLIAISITLPANGVAILFYRWPTGTTLGRAPANARYRNLSGYSFATPLPVRFVHPALLLALGLAPDTRRNPSARGRLHVSSKGPARGSCENSEALS